MKNRLELPYFHISGEYGGNQDWMHDWWMNLGGCGALTLCDLLIYCAIHKNHPEFFPGKTDELNKSSYRNFAMSVKPYLRPRHTGIKDIETYIDGVQNYLDANNFNDLSVSGITGYESFDMAKNMLIEHINAGMPASYLMLRHKDKKFDFFEWHWFIVNGYEIKDDKFFIKTATYGEARWLCMDELWDTGFDEKGGIVFFDLPRA